MRRSNSWSEICGGEADGDAGAAVPLAPDGPRPDDIEASDALSFMARSHLCLKSSGMEPLMFAEPRSLWSEGLHSVGLQPQPRNRRLSRPVSTQDSAKADGRTVTVAHTYGSCGCPT